MGSILPSPVFTALDNDGNPVVSGLLYTYASGSSTPQNTYTSSSLMTANANPVVMDSAGRAVVWLSDTNPYKFVLKTAAGSTIWTSDNISSYQPGAVANLEVLGTAGETIAKGQWCYLSDGGSGTGGLWYLTDSDDPNKIGSGFSGVAVANIAISAAGRIRMAGTYTESSGLTAGDVLWLRSTPGTVGAVQGIYSIAIGTAYSTTAYLIRNTQQSSFDESRAISYVVAGESFSYGDCVYCSNGDGGLTVGRYYKTSTANAYSSTAARGLGFAFTAVASAGDYFPLITDGTLIKSGSCTAGSPSYLTTAGALTTTAPATNKRLVGVGTEGTYSLLFYPSPPTIMPHTNTTAVGNVGAGTDDLITATIGGSTMSVNGNGIKITAWGTTAANANNKTITLNYGGTTLVTSGAVGFNNAPWYIEATVIRTGAATQVAVATFQAAATVVVTHSTPGETLTGDVTVKCTGNSGSNATDDIIQKALVVEFLI